jgi:hypothetical protein
VESKLKASVSSDSTKSKKRKSPNAATSILINKRAKSTVISRYCLTFGEVAEIRARSSALGRIGQGCATEGFTVAELKAAEAKFNALVPGCARLHLLSDSLPSDRRSSNLAGFLFVNNGVNIAMKEAKYAHAMQKEQDAVPYDEKYYDDKVGKTFNLQKRLNVVFGETSRSHSDNYHQCTVVGFDDVPLLKTVRVVLPTFLGDKARDLLAEGSNHFILAGLLYFFRLIDNACVSVQVTSTTNHIRVSVRMGMESAIESLALVLVVP